MTSFQWVEWLIISYFICINSGYLLLELASLIRMPAYIRERALDTLPRRYSEHEPPISIIVPAYNEEVLVVTAVSALLQLDYANYEIVVVNDGSTDATFERLHAAFDLEAEPLNVEYPTPCQPITGLHRSQRLPSLRVVTKVNGGGKADANNAGINVATYPLVCMVDADSILQPTTLRQLVRPYLEDGSTVAVGGTVRIANGCRVTDGLLTEARLPRRVLPLIQVVEYLRAFLFGRFGWDAFNAVHIISGALGLFERATLLEVGGYDTASNGEDLELTIRIHRVLKEHGREYRIHFVPDPIVWTDAPSDLKGLGRQRIRWQRGLAEALAANRSLIFRRGSGVLGWVNLPFQLLFEGLGPIIEVGGYAYFVFALFSGRISAVGMSAFLFLSIGVGMLLSAVALVLEELSFRVYPRVRDVAILFGVVIIENAGFRQLVAFWRIVGLFRYLTKADAKWAPIERSDSMVG